MAEFKRIVKHINKFSILAEFSCTVENRTVCLAKNADCVFKNGESICFCEKGYEKNASDVCTGRLKP